MVEELVKLFGFTEEEAYAVIDLYLSLDRICDLEAVILAKTDETGQTE